MGTRKSSSGAKGRQAEALKAFGAAAPPGRVESNGDVVPGNNGSFDAKAFLASVGAGRTITKPRDGDVIFSQGDPADALFYIQEGKVKVTTLSSHGKEAVVAILGAGDFFGEGCLAGQPLRISTVAAIATQKSLAWTRRPWSGSCTASQPSPNFSWSTCSRATFAWKRI